MKISIVTATYNSASTLRDTLESVLKQDYKDFEHIIVDGGSTDNTEEIIKEYESAYEGRLVFHSAPDKGIYDGMNKGIHYATGDIIGFLNSDDLYDDDHILSKISEGIKDVDAVYGDLVYVDKNDTSKIVRRWQGSKYYPKAFFKGWHPAHPTFYLKKVCYEQFGGYDLEFDVSADFELMFRVFEKGKITSNYIPETFVRMRLGGESSGSIKNIIRGNRNVLKAFRKNGFKVPNFYLVRRLWPKLKNMIKIKLHIA